MHPVTANHPPLMLKPPTLFLAFIVTGVALNLALPLLAFPGYVQYLIGPFLIAEGLIIIGMAFRQLNRASNNTSTDKSIPPLVTRGVYRFSRNPIYLGMFIGYVGIALLSSNVWLLILELPLFLAIKYGVILREEENLSGVFGAAYTDYRAGTRRWI